MQLYGNKNRFAIDFKFEIIGSTGVEVLKLLMEEHHLTQSDLPEIGPQSVVSEILHGKRQLNINHVKALAKRFCVSPEVFIDD